MMPEIQAIQAKYKGVTDQAALYQQQQETKEVYQKYGTSATGGCLQLLIQMPILFALYQVIYKLPGYVISVIFKVCRLDLHLCARRHSISTVLP